MRKLFSLFCILFFGLTCFAQQYTSVTATLTDSNGQAWANATYTIQIVAPFNIVGQLQNQGVAPISPITGTADGTGTISVSLDDNAVVKPAGSTWKFTICPNVNVNTCSSIRLVVTGASQSLSSQLSAALTVPVVNASPTIYRAYADNEVFGGQGSVYIRTTDGTLRGCNLTFCNGSGWTSIGGGGGGGSSAWSSLLSPTTNLTLNMNNFTTTLNMGVTGSSGAAYNITDDPNNTGTNYLFSINTGASSTANPFAVLINGNTNGIQVSSTGILSALGTGQNIATSLLNTGAGIGTYQMGSNGSGSVSQANTVKIMGNSNQLYASENAGAIAKVLLGGLSCGTSVLQSVSTSGTPTCLNILGGNNSFTGSNTWSNTQTFANLTITGTCSGCSGAAASPILILGGALSGGTTTNYFGNTVMGTSISSGSTQVPMPRAGTINTLMCRTGGSGLTGAQTYVFTVMKGLASNGSITPTAQALTCTMNSTNSLQCNDLNNADGFSVAAQDVLSVQAVPGGTPPAPTVNCEVVLN